MKKSEAAKEYLKTVHVPLIDTENVEAMLYNMRMMAFSAGHDAGVKYAIEQAEKLVRDGSFIIENCECERDDEYCYCNQHLDGALLLIKELKKLLETTP